MHRARILRIMQKQRGTGSALLLTRRSPLPRSYSSDIPPIPESPTDYVTEEQNEANESQLFSEDDPVPPHYHLTHPTLSRYDPLLDTKLTHVFPPNEKTPFANKITVRNVDKDFDSIFEVDWKRAQERGRLNEEEIVSETDNADVDITRHLPLSKKERDKLFHFPLVYRNIVQQTGKGQIRRVSVLVVVGNGDGLVGYGEGKALDGPQARETAFIQAVRNMDYVERFEKRTIFAEMHTKLGSTQIILRPRPVGFGLQCNPNIHQVLKAAGIKDISAKVWGSRNPTMVIKAMFRILHSGNAPLYMGNGVGGKGRRMFKGEPIQSREAVERARGRKLFDLRT